MFGGFGQMGTIPTVSTPKVNQARSKDQSNGKKFGFGEMRNNLPTVQVRHTGKLTSPNKDFPDFKKI